MLNKNFIYNFLCQNNNPLKKGIAILLLVSFTLYHFGYYAFYFSFKLKIESNWAEHVFSDSHDNLDIKLLEVPLSIPYMADQEEFQVTNTSFEKDGQYFRVIKQRYAKDTLQLVYVPDTAKKNLDQTIRQWISSLVHDEIPDGSGNSLLTKSFAKDYTQPDNGFDFFVPHFAKKHFSGFIFSDYQNRDIQLKTPPPELV